MKRAIRIGDLLQEEIGYIILQELRDPRIGFVTVTGVTVSDDLKHAKVYISVMGTPEDREQTLQGLNSARGYIQGCIGRRLKLRYTPEISFRLDTSASYGAHINDILRTLSKNETDQTEKEE